MLACLALQTGTSKTASLRINNVSTGNISEGSDPYCMRGVLILVAWLGLDLFRVSGTGKQCYAAPQSFFSVVDREELELNESCASRMDILGRCTGLRFELRQKSSYKVVLDGNLA